MEAPTHVAFDPPDPDAVGVVDDVVVALRGHVMEHRVAATATIAAPEGWHRVTITAMPGGHVVLGVRFAGLSKSRTNNVAEALDRRGWQLDSDGEGATHRHPPGTDAMTIAFEVLTMVGAAGAPKTTRRVTAADTAGTPVALVSSAGPDPG